MSMDVKGTAWISHGDEDADVPYWAENVACDVRVERSDDNEVHIGVQLDSAFDDASIYLTVAEASRLAHMLGIAVLANEAAAYEAAKL